ncbi:hypothetical protein QYF61_013983 [Mycteria americana]|uniref:Uncharacterized protein n=1 Tax=Mycteria americana TaxID=33587 RepID=A0AAN7MHJ5_MYCAM|nr:hypothetical protein QYF61_013983 [Mycteria americana]
MGMGMGMGMGESEADLETSIPTAQGKTQNQRAAVNLFNRQTAISRELDSNANSFGVGGLDQKEMSPSILTEGNVAQTNALECTHPITSGMLHPAPHHPVQDRHIQAFMNSAETTRCLAEPKRRLLERQSCWALYRGAWQKDKRHGHNLKEGEMLTWNRKNIDHKDRQTLDQVPQAGYGMSIL